VAAAALADWATGQHSQVRLPSRRWKRCGYTESVLVAVVIHPGPPGSGRPTKLIVKVCPTGRAAEETGRHQEAWQDAREFAEQHLVRQLFPRHPVGDGRYLMFQESAGSLLTSRTVSELPDEHRVAALRSAVDLVLRKWNHDGPIPRTGTAAAYLNNELRTALERPSVRRWADAAGLLVPGRDWISTEADAVHGAMPNPVRMAGPDSLVAGLEIDYLVGRSHGDLHVDNILVPVPQVGEPELHQMRFVDLSEYRPDAPLTRDLVTLLLSALLPVVPDLPADQADALLTFVLGPNDRSPPRLPPILVETVRELYRVGEEHAREWGDEWRAQYLLSVQAGATLYTTFDNARESGRWWYFRLAARAAKAFVDELDDPPVPTDPERVSPPSGAARATPSSERPQSEVSPLDMVPPPTGVVVHRKALVEQTLRLLRDCSTRVVGLGAALDGAGGIGKTVLAQEVGRSDEVRRLFPEGVLYVAVGADTTGAGLADKLNDLAEIVSGGRPALSVPDVAGNHLGRCIGDRRMLLIVDDVWSRSQLLPFLHGAPNCTRLVTTRYRSVVPDTLASVTVGTMTARESAELLSVGLDPLPQRARERMARLAHGWPILLALANGAIRRQLSSGSSAAAALDDVVRRLETEGPAALDITNADDRSSAVGATIDASTARIDEHTRQRYFELAIFPEDADIPIGLLDRFWAASNSPGSGGARQLCERLADMSLVTFVPGSSPAVRLHDVIRGYLRNRSGPAGLRALNDAFLRAVRPDPQWWRLSPDELYLWRFLGFHLQEAGRHDELAATFTDLRYIAAKLQVLGPVAVEADLTLAPGPVAAALLSGLQRSAHLLTAMDPPWAVVDTFLSRLAGEPALAEPVAAYRAGRGGWQLRSTGPMPDAQHPALHRVLHAHSSPIGGCVVSGDGDLFVTTSDDATVGVWDWATGQRIETLQGHEGPVLTCAVAPDGNWLATAGDDTTIRLWNLRDATETAVLRGHEAVVRRCAAGPDGTWLVSVSDDQTVRVWDVATGTTRAVLDGHAGTVRGCAVSGDGRWVATAGGDGSLRLWSTADWTQTRVFEGHTGAVRGCALSPDGSLLVSAGGDSTLRLWDVKRGILRAVLSGHTGSIRACAVDPSGAYVVSGGGDGTVRLWDVCTATLRTVLTGHRGAVRACAFSPDGAWLVTASEDGTVRTWNTIVALDAPTPVDPARTAVRASAGAAGGDWLVTGGTDALVRIWDVRTGRLQALLTGHTATVRCCAVSADGTLVATGGDDRTVVIWDAATGRRRATFDAHQSAVRGCAFGPDGSWVVSAAADGIVLIWDFATAKVRRQFGRPGPAIWACSVAPDGTWMATAGDDRVVRLWDTATGGPIVELTGHSSAIWACPIEPGGRWLATVGNDHTVRVWSAVGGEQTVHRGHTAWLNACVISPDGRWLASAGYDLDVRVWPADGGPAAPPPLTGHTAIVWTLAAGGEGRWLASAGTDETIRIWNTATWTIRTVIDVDATALRHCAAARAGGMVVTGGSGRVTWTTATGTEHAVRAGAVNLNAGAISGDGRMVYVGGEDGRIRAWDAETGAEVPLDLRHPGPALACLAGADGTWLATAGGDGTIHLWELPAGHLRTVLRGTSGSVRDLAVTPDGTLLVTAGDDGTRLWSLADGRPQLHLSTARGQWVRCCTVSPDGAWFAASGDDGVVRLWRVSDGTAIGELTGPGARILACPVTDDGHLLAAVADDRSVHVWSLPARRKVAAIRLESPVRHGAWLPGTHSLSVVGDAGVYRFEVSGSIT
jgi:WD40 repeat protein